jgi:gas vesicle protein
MSKGFVKGALLGSVLAAGAVLLLTPKTGEEMKKSVKKTVDEFKDSDNPQELVKEKANSAIDYVYDHKDEWKDIAQEKIEDIGSFITDKQTSLKEKDGDFSVDNILSTLKQNTSDMSDRFKTTEDDANEAEEDIVIVMPEDTTDDAIPEEETEPETTATVQE